MRVVWWVVVVVLTVVSAHDGDDRYSDEISKTVGDTKVTDGSNAIARFLGFKCPKGHRCLPVLECLPCDYGSYKSNEGSDLCENCPPGCTTLRKGAESWKECLPKCPPGFQQSECGKTCTKCRAGYYKSNWKNKPCNQCPKNSIWNRNMVGMKKKSQCYQSTKPECDSFIGDVLIALDVSRSVSEEDFRKELASVNVFIDNFDVSEDNTRFSVYTYPEFDGSIEDKFYSDKSELQDLVSGLAWPDVEHTNISSHLRDIADYLPSLAGNREHVADTVIVVTNSKSSSLSETAAAADVLKTEADKVFAVGIGDADEEELNTIASSENYVAKAENTDELAKRLPELTKDACELFKNEPEDSGSDETTRVTPTTDAGSLTTSSGDNRCLQQLGGCDSYNYEDVRLASNGTNCRKFCQCAHASTASSGTVSYYWVEHTCPSGTLFDATLPNCIHDWQVSCADTGSSTTASTPVSTTPGPAIVTGVDWCTINDTCTKEDYEVRRLKLMYGSNCEKFCHCATAEGSAGTNTSYYWQEQPCGTGTLFDISLPVPVCNHDLFVQCTACPLYGADIVFVVDASGSIGEYDFSKQTDFVNSIIDGFDVPATRFAVITYASQVLEVINFEGYTDKQELQEKVWGLSYTGGSTETDVALDYVRTKIISAGNRPAAVKIVIVITDGLSTYPTLTSEAASDLQDAVDMVLAVGIKDANLTELTSIASDDDYVFYVDDISVIDSLQGDIQRTACGVDSESTAEPTPTAAPTAAPTTSPTTSPTPTTSVAGLDDRNCTLAGCSGVDYYSSPLSGCRTYCQCEAVTGTWITSLNCSRGTLFANNLQICDYESNVDLTDCTSTSP